MNPLADALRDRRDAMPDRIWATPSQEWVSDDLHAELPVGGDTEYVRADLAAHDAQPPPTEAELEAMARAICDAEWGGTQKWERWPDRFKARYHELALAAYTARQSMRDK